MKKEDIKVGVKVKPKFDLTLFYTPKENHFKRDNDIWDDSDMFTIVEIDTWGVVQLVFDIAYCDPIEEPLFVACAIYQTIPQLLACFEVVEDEL